MITRYDDHDPAEHHIYMARLNRRWAHNYRNSSAVLLREGPPPQFYWHMREAIRWIQTGKKRRENYANLMRNFAQEVREKIIRN